MKKILLSICMFLAFGNAMTMSAQVADYNVIPLPKEVKTDTTQSFTLTNEMTIACDVSNPELLRNAQFLCEWVKQISGIEL